MPKAIMFVQSRPSTPDREDEYNDWYTNTHLPEVLDIPGITAARRFKASDVAPPADGAHQYCAVYELECDDLDAVMPALARTVRRRQHAHERRDGDGPHARRS